MKPRRNVIKSIASKAMQNVINDVVKHLIKNSIESINEQTTEMIEFKNGSPGYDRVNKVLYDLDPVKYERHRIHTKNKNYYNLLSGTRYRIKLDCTNCVLIEKCISKDDENILKITFRGTSCGKHASEFRERYDKLSEAERRISVRYIDGGRATGFIRTTPRTFDNLILKDDIHKSIINKLVWLKNNRSWYESHQLVYKIGVLLYGKPGTGKSSVIKAISSMFNLAPILILNKEDIYGTIRYVNSFVNQDNCTVIVLIEDIDMLFAKRENMDGNTQLRKMETKTSSDSLQVLFQLLDGPFSTNNTIYIATTNFRDKLDEALIRHGRFDIQYELEYFDYTAACKFVKLFGYDESILDRMNIDYPVQPAYLQNSIIDYTIKEVR